MGSGEERSAEETDLAARHLGSTVLAASDESFGEKENLLNEASASFEPGRYGHRGELVDGWETRRRRGEPGHDWVIVRLGVPGTVTAVDVDTSFFTGNYPQTFTLEGCGVEGYPGLRALQAAETEWIELVAATALKGGEHNVVAVSNDTRLSHIRLSSFPDGGIARLRIYGRMLPDPRELDGVTIDLLSERNGSFVASCSDGYYSSPRQLIRPDEARVMGEGWETRRRRDDGHDVVVFGLGIAGRPRQAVIETTCFRYNSSESVELWGSGEDAPSFPGSTGWSPILDRTALEPDTRHVFSLREVGTIRWLRLDAFPDGGLARLRLLGDVGAQARKEAGLRFLNSLPLRQTVRILTDLGIVPTAAAELAHRRPLTMHDAASLPALGPLFEGRPYD